MLHDRFRVAPALLQDFQNNGLSSSETVLILTLADYTGTDPGTILSLHKNGLSWSAIAHNFGLASSPKGVGPHGIAAVIIGLLVCLFIGFTMRKK